MNGYKKKAALFLASQGVTLFGSSLVQFVIIWYVTLLTSSGAWVFALTAASCVPQFVISFFSGVWADRYSKKLLIILSDAVIAVSTLALALLLPKIGEGNPLLVALVLISVIRSAGAGVQGPAVSAAIPLLVPTQALMRFNGINSTVQSLVQFAAPAAAGVLLTVATLRESLFVDVATAAVGIGILFAIAIPFERADGSPSLLREMSEGFRYAAKDGFVGKLLIVYGLFIFLCVPAGFLATLYVSRYFGSEYWYLSAVEVVGFLGMTAGGVLISAWSGFKNRVLTLAAGIALFGTLALLMSAAQNFYLYLALMAVYGIALTAVQTASTTLLQENVAPQFHGRIFGLFGAMYSGFLPLGMAVFGPLSDAVSMRLLMALSGALLLVMAAYTVLDRRFRLRVASKEKAEQNL